MTSLHPTGGAMVLFPIFPTLAMAHADDLTDRPAVTVNPLRAPLPTTQTTGDQVGLRVHLLQLRLLPTRRVAPHSNDVGPASEARRVLPRAAQRIPKSPGRSEASSSPVLSLRRETPLVAGLEAFAVNQTWGHPRRLPALRTNLTGDGREQSHETAHLVSLQMPDRKCFPLTHRPSSTATSSTPPTPQLARRKLELLPRSTAGSAVPSPLSSPNPANPASQSRSNPFGTAK